MKARLALALPLFAAGATACSHPPQGTDWVPPGPLVNARVVSNDLWSGNDVTVISSSFKALAALPTIQLASKSLVSRRIDDSTIAATLPDTDGVFALHVSADSFQTFDASIEVHGFQGYQLGPNILGTVQPVPGTATIYASIDTGGLYEYDMQARRVTRQWPDTIHSIGCTSGVGPSVRPGHIVLAGVFPAPGTCGDYRVRVWQYGATMVAKDLLPRGFGCTAYAEIGPTGRLCGGKQQTFLFATHCIAGTCGADVHFSTVFNNTSGISIDPTGKYAILHNDAPFLINATTGDSLFSLTNSSLLRVHDATFSSAGDTVYIVADSFLAGGSATRVVKVFNTHSGASLANILLPEGASGIAIDPTQPRLYVTGLAGSTPLVLTVIDTRTLTKVATLRAPAAAGPSVAPGTWDKYRVVPYVRGAVLFVVATSSGVGTIPTNGAILRFGLPRQ